VEKEQFSLLGKIIKTFGYKGELTVCIEDGFCKKIKKTEFVFVEIQHERVPFFIISIENQYNNIFTLRLEDVDSLEKAQKLAGCRLFTTETAKHKNSSKNVDLKSLEGFDVYDDKHGKIGKINQVLELPQQYILQIFHHDKEILVPFNENIVKDINIPEKAIYISTPEGLIDFYLK